MINKRYKHLREKNNYTQKYIAKKLKISICKYQRKEQGKAFFNDIEIFKLSKLYLVKESYFLTYKGR
ncbi:helix-turn-helix domain-containing protein [Apilactobacillus xinyiensis]|uniref:helix-turn-helix domain-containing protein n=1 Tax=Apilactobacillus xinyiensis TaxID=2841032 RepID=UPI00200F0114|nr:helix-turn-helix transcriptional regulator [Apilactobacillus xinyiensis]MCL0330849.1 helix-turn-helix domain-containing protein [Apilactobacillus xinyiensis]